VRKVWIDCGAHFGESTERFVKKHKNFETFLFEPNPHIKCKFRAKPYAIWTEYCKVPFYFYTNDKTSEGCTLFESKRGKVDKEHPAMVGCIDFSDWIAKTFKPEDFIVVKMDIEGAEYDVLEKLIETNIIEHINIIYIEWHQKKCGIDTMRHKRLKKKLKAIAGLQVRKEFAHHKGRHV